MKIKKLLCNILESSEVIYLQLYRTLNHLLFLQPLPGELKAVA